MKTNHLILIIFFTLISLSGSRTNAQDNYFKEPTYQEATVASLGKFGDIPVSYHTGVPSISIPIYTVYEGGLQLPISVSYHASGIRNNEIAGFAGLGWAVQAGGVIYRSVNGAPDEGIQRTSGCTNRNGWGFYTNAGLPPEIENPDCDINNQYINNCPCYSYFYDAARGFADTEPDLFSFNFNGKSGKFYFDENQQAVLLPRQDVKIEVINFPDSWLIKDTDGTRYYFDQVSKTYNYIPGGSGSIGNDTYSTSSWYLSKIESKFNNAWININYVSDQYGFGNRQSQSIQKINSEPLTGGVNGVSRLLNYTWVDGLRISSITTSSNSVTVSFIEGAARTDLSEYADLLGNVNTNSKSLQEISIQSPNLCKKFSLGTSYFISSASSSDYDFSDQTDTKRLKLEWIQEKSCDGTVEKPKYEFTYYESADLPRRYSLGVDHWGYANSYHTQNDLIPSGIKLSDYTTGATFANRTPDLTYVQAFTLKMVKYPTGGTSEFTFELHRDLADNPIGGLRVKQILNKDLDGSVVKTNTYSYEFPNLLDGDPMTNYVQDLSNNVEWQSWNLLMSGDQRLGQRAISSPSSILTSTQGYHIGYGKVIVTDANEGSEEYTFTNYSPVPATYEYPSPPPFQAIGIGRLTSSLFKDSGSNDVQDMQQAHTTAVGKTLTGIRVVAEYSPDGSDVGSCCGQQSSRFLIKTNYSYTSQYSRLTGKTMIKDGVRQATSYTYGNIHNFPITESTVNSKGQVETVSYTYPTELTGTIFTQMVANNRISTPVILEKSLISGSTTIPIEKVVNNFEDIFGEPHQTRTEVYPTASSELVTYNYLYNSDENIVQNQKDNDRPVVFLYDGYRNPVAKITDIQYSDLLANQAILLGDIQTGTENLQLKADLIALKGQLSANTMMEIYLYKVGVGVEEKIDVNSRSTFYTYDPLGRLILIKDHDGFILKKVEYKYYSQD